MMSSIDDWLNHYSTNVPTTFTPFAVKTCNQRTCPVCNNQLSDIRPNTVTGRCWCVNCGDMFDRLAVEPVKHKLYSKSTNQPVGEFIGFGGYNQLLLDHQLKPGDVYSSHFKEGEFAYKFNEIHRFHNTAKLYKHR